MQSYVYEAGMCMKRSTVGP